MAVGTGAGITDGRETARKVRTWKKEESQWSRGRQVQGRGLVLDAVYR